MLRMTEAQKLRVKEQKLTSTAKKKKYSARVKAVKRKPETCTDQDDVERIQIENEIRIKATEKRANDEKSNKK